MNKEREGIKSKARSKRQRRADNMSTGKAALQKKAQDKNPNATLTEKVMDMAQDAAAQVGDFVKAAAHKITGTTAEADPPSDQKNPKVRSRPRR
jgi:hypothetical protein